MHLILTKVIDRDSSCYLVVNLLKDLWMQAVVWL